MMNYEEIEVLNWLLANEIIYRGRTRLPISPVLRGIKQELEQIDNTKPSEAMKCLEKLGTHRIEYWESLELGSTIPFKSTMEYKIIKQALQQKITKHQVIEDTYYTWEENKEALENKNSKLEKENVEYKDILRVIFEKNVDIELLKRSENWLDYYTRFKHKTGKNTELTEEEFELLKRY